MQNQRRKLLKWSVPVITSVALPVHAQTSTVVAPVSISPSSVDCSILASTATIVTFSDGSTANFNIDIVPGIGVGVSTISYPGGSTVVNCPGIDADSFSAAIEGVLVTFTESNGSNFYQLSVNSI